MICCSFTIGDDKQKGILRFIFRGHRETFRSRNLYLHSTVNISALGMNSGWCWRCRWWQTFFFSLSAKALIMSHRMFTPLIFLLSPGAMFIRNFHDKHVAKANWFSISQTLLIWHCEGFWLSWRDLKFLGVINLTQQGFHFHLHFVNAFACNIAVPSTSPEAHKVSA